ncbi:MAG TPA: GNAT family protein [Candidatus Hydrogenedentes bacterium]|nr:GNAT family protein [Candidatus Hydrogenedentota bacterium]HOL75956.1 GNAT family protein [Candidatus Hydrogenedentota bacterium]HPO85635.1 GNAT family protein [Candidatus Hydrogenedentota bacterium]
MIVGEHAVVRIADPDDAVFLARLFDPDMPRAFSLNIRRELQYLTIDDLREALSHKDFRAGLFYTIEDLTGLIRGFFSIKTPLPEVNYSEFLFGLASSEDYDSPLAKNAMEILERLAFVQKRLNKLVAQCLENETDFRSLLEARGFTSDGIQRDVLFTGGRYLNLETFTLFRSDYLAREPIYDESPDMATPRRSP